MKLRRGIVRLTAFLFALGAFVSPVKAHCPLCTAGAGAGVVIARYLGVSLSVIGVFIGAFSLAIGLMTAKYIDKQYVPYQTLLITVTIYLSVVVPIIPMMSEYTLIYLPIEGAYGMQGFVVNEYLLGLPFGTAVVALTPRLSKEISQIREKTIQFQGVILTFVLLTIISVVLHLSV